VILEHLLQTHNSAEQSCERFIVFFFLNFVQNNIGGEISNNYYPRSNGAPCAFVLESTRSQCVQPLKRFFVATLTPSKFCFVTPDPNF